MFYKVILAGFFLMPFENLFLAPSTGWPAISPIVFVVAFFSAFSQLVWTRKELILVVIFSFWSVVGWLVSFSFFEGNRFFIRDVFSGFFPIFLGYCFYKIVVFSLVKEDFFYSCVRFYIRGSFLALAISMIILVFGYILRIEFFLDFLSLFIKRNHEMLRFSFLFAEPSFVSVHLLGVVAPLTWVCWKRGYLDLVRSLIYIGIIYIVFAVLFMDSARFYLDVAFLTLLFSYFWIFRAFHTLSGFKLIFMCVSFSIVAFFLTISPEVLNFLTFGRVSTESSFLDAIGSDASLASRYFRTDAVLNAVATNPVLLLFGAGVSNVGFVVDLGFDAALINFSSMYTKELDDIYYLGNGSNVFNMYARLVGEFGLLFSFLLFVLMYRKEHAFVFFVLLWCYLQFDSYAFYGIWIYLAIISNYACKAQPPLKESIS